MDKIPSFVSLYSGNQLNISVLTDFHAGEKKKVDRLRSTGILQEGRIFLASDYTGFQSSDIEDILGAELYIHLVNQCYDLKGQNKLKIPKTNDGSIIKHVEAHMCRVIGDIPEFDHYAPSEYLLEHPSLFDGFPDRYNEALDRFEKLFVGINSDLAT